MSDRQLTFAFIATILVLLALMAGQVRHRGESSLLAHYTRTAVSPLVGSVSWVARTTATVWNRYVYLVGVEKERAQLIRRLARLEAEQVRLGEVYRENRRLRTLVGLQGGAAFPRGVLSRVVSYLAGGPGRRTVLVNRGSHDGVGPGWVALSQGAVVGRVINSSGHTSEVLLVIDPDSGVAVRHEDGRYAGVLRGGNEGPSKFLPLDYVPRDVPVAVGELLVTSGLDQIYPPGLLVGWIRELEADSPLTWTIRVQVGFAPSELEEVLLVPPVTDNPETEVPVTETSGVELPMAGVTAAGVSEASSTGTAP